MAKSNKNKIILALFSDNGLGEQYHIGSVMVHEDFVSHDIDDKIKKLWNTWHDAFPEPDTDSQFIDWLIDTKEDFEVPPVPVSYVVIES